MAIYIFDSEIEITEARMIPVWIELNPERIKWHYAEPKKVPKKSEVRLEPVWHIRAHWKINGDRLHQGRWRDLAGVTADEGIHEIIARCHELAPDQEAKFQKWVKEDGPKATDLFDPVGPKEVA